MVSHSRRVEQVKRPLFPLYLFARFDVAKDDYGIILRTTGVHALLGKRNDEASRPLPVPDVLIEMLREAADNCGDEIELDKPMPPFSPGTRVRIIEGHCEGLEGIVAFDHHRRVRVFLDIMGRQTPIVVPRESLATR